MKRKASKIDDEPLLKRVKRENDRVLEDYFTDSSDEIRYDEKTKAVLEYTMHEIREVYNASRNLTK